MQMVQVANVKLRSKVASCTLESTYGLAGHEVNSVQFVYLRGSLEDQQPHVIKFHHHHVSVQQLCLPNKQRVLRVYLELFAVGG